MCVCVCLLVGFVISIGMKPHCVPGKVVVRFHLGIVGFAKDESVFV